MLNRCTTTYLSLLANAQLMHHHLPVTGWLMLNWCKHIQIEWSENWLGEGLGSEQRDKFASRLLQAHMCLVILHHRGHRVKEKMVIFQLRSKPFLVLLFHLPPLPTFLVLLFQLPPLPAFLVLLFQLPPTSPCIPGAAVSAATSPCIPGAAVSAATSPCIPGAAVSAATLPAFLVLLF